MPIAFLSEHNPRKWVSGPEFEGNCSVAQGGEPHFGEIFHTFKAKLRTNTQNRLYQEYFQGASGFFWVHPRVPFPRTSPHMLNLRRTCSSGVQIEKPNHRKHEAAPSMVAQVFSRDKPSSAFVSIRAAHDLHISFWNSQQFTKH